jgi:hypothetical protein
MKAAFFVMTWLATACTLQAGLVSLPLPVEPDTSDSATAAPYFDRLGTRASEPASLGQRLLHWARAIATQLRKSEDFPARSPFFYEKKTDSNRGFSGSTGKTDVCAVLSFVFGLLTLTNPYTALPFGIAAIVLGFVALKRIRERGTKGQGWALAGIIMGFLFLLLWVVMALLMLLLVGFYLFHIIRFF